MEDSAGEPRCRRNGGNQLLLLRIWRTKWKTLEFKWMVSNPVFIGTILFPALWGGLGWRVLQVDNACCHLGGWMSRLASMCSNRNQTHFWFTPSVSCQGSKKELKRSCCEILRVFKTQVCTILNSTLYSSWVFLESLARNGWLALVVQKTVAGVVSKCPY